MRRALAKGSYLNFSIHKMLLSGLIFWPVRPHAYWLWGSLERINGKWEEKLYWHLWQQRWIFKFSRKISKEHTSSSRRVGVGAKKFKDIWVSRAVVVLVEKINTKRKKCRLSLHCLCAKIYFFFLTEFRKSVLKRCYKSAASTTVLVK